MSCMQCLALHLFNWEKYTQNLPLVNVSIYIQFRHINDIHSVVAVHAFFFSLNKLPMENSAIRFLFCICPSGIAGSYMCYDLNVPQYSRAELGHQDIRGIGL